MIDEQFHIASFDVNVTVLTMIENYHVFVLCIVLLYYFVSEGH